jgi:hypothetical protein
LNRRLILLNVVLAGAVVYAGVEVRRQWVAAKEREVQIRRGSVPPAPAPPFTLQPEVPPVMASGYATIAQRFLLDPSRNPDLPIEVPPPLPPPPPRPPLPFFHGMMNIGDGPEISLSQTSGSVHKWLHPGETIGDFKLVAFTADDIELEWNGQRIVKQLAELSGHEAGPGQPAETSAEAEPAPVRVAKPPGNYGPDAASNAVGEHSCVDGDTTPAGTVLNGLQKTIVKNPLFGSENCIWRPVGR